MKKLSLLVGFLSVITASYAQLTIQEGAGLHLQPNSFITVQNDLESRDDVSGEGLFLLNGQGLQTINFHGGKTAGLLIDNVNNVELSSPVSITKSLVLKKGHLICNANTLELMETASIDGGNAKSFIVTSVKGQIRKILRQDLSNYSIPVGNSDGYAPVIITTSGNYQDAFIEVSAQNKIHPSKPETDDYLEHFWSINRKGVTGTLMVKAVYNHIKGEEQDLKGFYWNGIAWSDKQCRIDLLHHAVAVSAAEGKGEIYAYNPGTNKRGANLSVFPNPAQSIATVQLISPSDMNSDLIVYDTYGHVVLSKKIILKQGTNQFKVNVSGFAKGQYTIKVAAEDHVHVISLVKG
jgi:hypothetical protein